ncbi:hypothetical protein BH23ACT9_BH23ACT9_28740 [soil metagenome]
MVRAGRTPEELSRDYEPTSQTIRNWVRRAYVDDGHADGVTTDERAELAQLRREIRILREEREILNQAAAWFAAETGAAWTASSTT